MRDREDMRAANIARDRADLPSSALYPCSGDPAPACTGTRVEEPLGRDRSLDLPADLLERVRKLEQTASAQDEVIRGLVIRRTARKMPQDAPGPAPGPAQGESRPQGRGEGRGGLW